jgi:50S ribosomal protein L16 3-hydroxylase
MTSATAAPSLLLPDDLDRERFLNEIWQRRPLLMRQALAGTPSPLTPDDLAGLACDPDIESRIVAQHDDGHWEIRHGPFDVEDFAALPPSNWTLLVQDVDKWVPEVHALIDHFDFVPTWRIDDIMVSYAADGGGVGPHTDAYDVFLVQLHGRRRWRLSFAVYGDGDLEPDIEQRILKRFETDVDWTLEPGDILYLPPGVAHWGTASGDCMTYSLGFRSPSQRDLASDWLQEVVERAGERRLADPDDVSGRRLAEISTASIITARALVDDAVHAAAADFPTWVGRYLTEPKPQFQLDPQADPWDDARLQHALDSGEALHRHPWARVAWNRNADGTVHLFCNGMDLALGPAPDAQVACLTEMRVLTASRLDALAADAAIRRAIVWLVNLGALG